jgi:hypothetical protein
MRVTSRPCIDLPPAAVPLSDFDHRAQLRRAVIASTVGTTIEWYDFLLYGQMAALVYAKLYFPSSDPLTGVLQAFAVFAVGFVARARRLAQPCVPVALWPESREAAAGRGSS